MNNLDKYNIKRGDFLHIFTLERFKLSKGYCAIIGPYAGFSTVGMNLHYGSQIDPGFDGHLLLGISNHSSFPRLLEKESSIVIITFFKLDKNALIGYKAHGAISQTGYKIKQMGRFTKETARELYKDIEDKKILISLNNKDVIDSIGETLNKEQEQIITPKEAIDSIRSHVRKYWKSRHEKV